RRADYHRPVGRRGRQRRAPAARGAAQRTLTLNLGLTLRRPNRIAAGRRVIMRRFRMAAWGACGLAAAGCYSFDEPRPESFVRKAEPQIALPTLTPGSTEAAARVDTVGRGILAANPRIGAKPLFRTIGAPQP